MTTTDAPETTTTDRAITCPLCGTVTPPPVVWVKVTRRDVFGWFWHFDCPACHGAPVPSEEEAS